MVYILAHCYKLHPNVAPYFCTLLHPNVINMTPYFCTLLQFHPNVNPIFTHCYTLFLHIVTICTLT